MDLRTKTFLAVSGPAVGLLLVCMWTLGPQVDSHAADELRASERQNQKETGLQKKRDEAQINRVLSMVAENPLLISGLQLIGANENDFQAREQLETQITEIAKARGFDLLEIAAPNGRALAAVRRGEHGIEPIPLVEAPGINGFITFGGVTYKLTSAPVDQDQQNVGHLALGERLDLSRYRSPVVLVSQGKIIASSDKQFNGAEMEAALASCTPAQECDVKTGNGTYFSLVLETSPSGDTIRSLKNLDSAGDPLEGAVHNVFLPAIFAAVALGAFVAYSATKPKKKSVTELKDSPVPELKHS